MEFRGKVVFNGNDIRNFIPHKCLLCNSAFTSEICPPPPHKNSILLDRGYDDGIMTVQLSDKYSKSIKMVEQTSVIVMTSVSQAHQGHKWMQHEYRKCFCKNDKLQFEIYPLQWISPQDLHSTVHDDLGYLELCWEPRCLTEEHKNQYCKTALFTSLMH